MKEILDFAVEIARQAGEITLKYFRGDIKVDTKQDLSPVTIADRQAEEFLRGEIEKRFPDDAILGEEYGVKEGKSGYRWILDPIDGTKSFIRGIAMYGTMVAVEYRGESKVGVVRFPPTNETIAALAGSGCLYNGQKCGVSKTEKLNEATALTTSLNDFVSFFGPQALLNFSTRTGVQRTWGDCYGYLLVATGRADIMIDPIVHVWDAAPIIPIIQESGGMITNLDGKSSLEIKNLIATNGRLHEAAISMLRNS